MWAAQVCPEGLKTNTVVLVGGEWGSLRNTTAAEEAESKRMSKPHSASHPRRLCPASQWFAFETSECYRSDLASTKFPLFISTFHSSL